MISVERYHDFSFGHRVMDEGKCSSLHGHNARVTFTVRTKAVDVFGHAAKFQTIKDTLCEWLELNWDHKMLLHMDDPAVQTLADERGIIVLPFHPTAENLAAYLLNVVGPCLLDVDWMLVRVKFEETRKCAVVAEVGFV